MKKKDIKTKQVQDLEKKVEELEGQLARALADYQNLERRVQEQRGDWIRTANKDLLLRLLPVLDTLMLAAKHSSDEGVKLSVKQFIDTLRNEGIEKIETEGKTFDPKLMECVSTIEGEDNKVLEEVRSGYIMGDTVIRPAQVRVGKQKIAEQGVTL